MTRSPGLYGSLAAPTEPGMYADVPNSVYHADKNSVSSSGLQHLLNTCPAQFKHDRDNPRTESVGHFDMGTAFHTLTLGVGPELVEIKAQTWDTKAAREGRASAWAEGKTPLLTKQLVIVKAMATAVRSNDIAITLLCDGAAERSLYWPDPVTGVMLRCRPDWLPDSGGRLIMVDLKSAESADPAAFSKAAANFGYAMQAPFYRSGAIALDLDPDPAFVFIVVSKKPPYLVSVVELDAEAMAYGAARNRRAIDLYARCAETDTWPDWGTDVHLVSLPRWAHYAEESTHG